MDYIQQKITSALKPYPSMETNRNGSIQSEDSTDHEMNIYEASQEDTPSVSPPNIKDAKEGTFTHMLSGNLYPEPKPYYDGVERRTPFSKIEGEYELYLGKSNDDLVCVTNFRLFILRHDAFLNLPLTMIESMERQENNQLLFTTKDGRSTCYKFTDHDTMLRWHERIVQGITGNFTGAKLEERAPLFAYYFWSGWQDTCLKEKIESQSKRQATPPFKCVGSEARKWLEDDVIRQGIDGNIIGWRVSMVNKSYAVCDSYPELVVVPRKIPDDIIKEAAGFRSFRRFPAVSWRHPVNGSVLCRSAQPHVGFFNWRNTSDEMIMSTISGSTLSDRREIAEKSGTQLAEGITAPRLCIVDCRSYTASIGNKVKGGGTEYTEYYDCDIEYLNLPNIHIVRKSFYSLTALLHSLDVSSWLSSLDSTKWLTHLSSLLRAAVTVTHYIHVKERPVLVHCSDGWDRTSQITALSELLLDPYYRTIPGFRVVVEREFLSFGHKFADRNGNIPLTTFPPDEGERSPIFLQFLDCVHQMIKQFPIAFEFNTSFLIKLAQHTFSSLFGTFLFNCERERQTNFTHVQTFSVWSLLDTNRQEFINSFYKPEYQEVLFPACHVSRMSLFSELYTAPLFTTFNKKPYGISPDFVRDIIPFSLPIRQLSIEMTVFATNGKVEGHSSTPLPEKVNNIEADGLPPIRDELQECISGLSKQLGRGGTSRSAPTFNGHIPNGHAITPLPDVTGVVGEERGWQVVKKSDSDFTLWVPDHAATNCARCHAPFWTAIRKHHCRKCGRVFCGKCSNYFAPVPDENLHENVRVCANCFDRLDGFLNFKSPDIP